MAAAPSAAEVGEGGVVSPRTHLYVVGMLRFMSYINQPSLPTPFYSVLVSISVFMALSIVFHSIKSPEKSPLSHLVLPVLVLLSLGLSSKCLVIKFSLSPDIILCG